MWHLAGGASPPADRRSVIGRQAGATREAWCVFGRQAGAFGGCRGAACFAPLLWGGGGAKSRGARMD